MANQRAAANQPISEEYLLRSRVDGLDGSLVARGAGCRHQSRRLRQLARVLVELVRLVREIHVSVWCSFKRHTQVMLKLGSKCE